MSNPWSGRSACAMSTDPTPIGKHRRYTKRQKATVVIAAEMSSMTAASEASGIPISNIARWRDDPELAKLGQKTREEVADGFRVLTELVIERLIHLIPTMEARDLTILAGVAVDKGQLLSGAATARTESLSGDVNETERSRFKAVLRKASEAV